VVLLRHFISSFHLEKVVMREAYLAPLWMLGYGDSPPESKSKQPGAVAEPLTLEPDTVLLAELQTSVDASDAKPGDPITARVIGHTWRPTKGLLPAGSALSGRVMEVRARSQQDPESRLAICFDQAVLKDGSTVPLNLVVSNFAEPRPAVCAAVDSTSGASGLRDVELASAPREAQHFIVLTSTQHDVKLKRHLLVYLRVAPTEKEARTVRHSARTSGAAG
jgi:hypothetical protein